MSFFCIAVERLECDRPEKLVVVVVVAAVAIAAAVLCESRTRNAANSSH